MLLPKLTLLRRACVLVVDDDSTTRLLISSLLSDEGYAVLCAADGSAALQLLDQHAVDCVVTDINMPGMDGFALCQALRAVERFHRLQVLFLTGLNDYDSIKRAYAVGGNDFASKQSNPQLLVERVRFLLRGQQVQDSLRASEMRLQHAQRTARLGHWDRRPDGSTVAASPVLLELLDETELRQLSWQRLCQRAHPEDVDEMQRCMHSSLVTGAPFRLDHRLLGHDGSVRVLRHVGEVAVDDEGQALIRSSVQDISEVTAKDERIRYLARHDTLTKLPNRESLVHTLATLMDESSATLVHPSVFAIEINDAGRITGSLGRNVVDSVLQTCGSRLRDSLAALGDVAGAALHSGALSLVGRADGEKFICAVDLISPASAIAMARRLQGMLAVPIPMGDYELMLTVSVGISISPQHGANAAELVDHALAALANTGNERGAVQLFTADINARARERLSLEAELRRALEQQQFEVHYQPRLHTNSGQLSGAEALVRWRHPTRGLIMPGSFITVLEDMGLIGRLSSQVVELAARQSKIWGRRFGNGFRVSCNLSPLQFGPMNLLAEFDEAVARARAGYDFLEVEITEGALISGSDQVQKILLALRERGVRLALDDFGTGFSSLSYLRRLPLDILKVDRSFVADVGTSQSGRLLVQAVLQMARALGLECVAEGVELPEQLQFLVANRCREVQGFLLARPMPSADFERWVAETEPQDWASSLRSSARTA